MTGLSELEVQGVGIMPDRGDHVMILREKGKQRLLVIGIGPTEAASIAMAHEGIKTPRPLTHDLTMQLLFRLRGKLERSIIHDVRDDAYIGQIDVSTDCGVLEIDCRSSDAVALALRANAPIFASEHVLDIASVHESELVLNTPGIWHESLDDDDDDADDDDHDDDDDEDLDDDDMFDDDDAFADDDDETWNDDDDAS